MLSYGFVFRTHNHGSSKSVMFGFAGNFFPLHKMHFFPKKIGEAYYGLCLFVYLFSKGTSWRIRKKRFAGNFFPLQNIRNIVDN